MNPIKKTQIVYRNSHMAYKQIKAHEFYRRLIL